MLYFRDRSAIIPSLRDGAPTTGALSDKNMVGPGVYFTESMDVGTYTEIIAFLNVTANDGGSTLDIKFQGSPDGKTFTDLSDAFTQVTTTNGQTLKRLTANFGRYIRACITLTGADADYTLSLTLMAKG
jgi:hypothetical protein